MGNLLGRQRHLRANGKVVLITGCSVGGIGYSLALEFSKRGATVFATARRMEAMAGLSEQGIKTLSLDVTSEKSIADAVNAVVAKAGRIDVLVNNAGVSAVGPTSDLPIAKWRQVLDTNVVGAVAMVQAVFPVMARQRSGRIVNVGSVAAYCNRPWASGYSASKAALHAITNCMRMEMRPFGVDVVLLAPGYIRTNIFDNGLSEVQRLPPNSPYVAYEAGILAQYKKRTTDTTMMPVARFAKKAVDAALQRPAKWRLVVGASSGAAMLASWLPMRLRDFVLWSRFGAPCHSSRHIGSIPEGRGHGKDPLALQQ